MCVLWSVRAGSGGRLGGFVDSHSARRETADDLRLFRRIVSICHAPRVASEKGPSASCCPLVMGRMLAACLVSVPVGGIFSCTHAECAGASKSYR